MYTTPDWFLVDAMKNGNKLFEDIQDNIEVLETQIRDLEKKNLPEQNEHWITKIFERIVLWIKTA